jgi:uncharacterized membrane protein affecting hemolysin expression
MAETNAPKTPAPADPAARQRSRNIAIALCLVFLIVLFYLITIFKMGGNVLNRSL